MNPSTPVVRAPRILLVEDEPSIAVTLGDDLEHSGFQVTCSRDGADAIRLLASTDYDAEVTDLRLPGADGFAVLRAARHRAPTAPVLVISASRGAALAADEQGADGFLAKPFANECVLDWLRQTGPKCARPSA